MLERLRLGQTVVGDGAWGTLLIEQGLRAGECPEAWNFERPEVLREIASLYLEAGAEILTTNTFGASPLKLACFSLDERTEEINRLAVKLLRGVAGDGAYISGSVGPTAKVLKPYGDTEEETVYQAFELQIGALAGAGVDLICVETMTDLREARLAIEAARSVAPQLTVMATMTFDATPRGFFTVMGVDVPHAVEGLALAGADIIGSNCGNGIDGMVGIARELARHSDFPLAIQSNAGLPQNRDGRLVYPETPEFMAERVPELIGLGVRVIGGCCGTGPEHIRAIRGRVG